MSVEINDAENGIDAAEQCRRDRHCQRAASLGTIDPFAPCPGQRDGDPESYVNVEAETIPTY